MNFKSFLKKNRRSRLIVFVAIIAIILPLAVNTLLNVTSNRVLADSFFKFDEGYGTTDAVNDSNSAVSAGSITGATWKTEDMCFDGKCLYFDGDGDYVSFADDPDLDFAGSDSGSIMGWFRHAPFTPIIDLDHETGDLSEYTGSVTDGGDLSVSATAALNGTGYGMSVLIDDVNQIYAYKSVTANTSGTIRIGFYMDPNTLSMTSGDNLYMVGLRNSSLQYIGHIQLTYTSPNYVVSLVLNNDSGSGFVASYNITDAPHYVEAVWYRATTDTSTNGYAKFWIDGNYAGWVSAKDNYDIFGNFANVLFGATGVDSGTSGTLYLDEMKVYAGTPQVIVSKYETTGADGGYKVYFENDGNVACGIDYENTYFPYDSAYSLTADYDDNRWHHFACVKDSSSSLTLYLDALKVGSDESITSSTLANDDTFYIGIDGDGASNDYQGFIDEIKVYRSAKTETDIKGDYIKGSTLGETSASFGLNDQSYLSDGLVGYWKMDESSGDASDSSGNGYTLTNNGTTAFTTGKFGNGSEHVPASTQYLSTASTVTGVKSVSFWVNPDSNTNYYLSLTSGAYITSSSGVISATGFTNPKIYVNGVQGTTISADTWQLVNVTIDTAIDANQFYIGRVGSNYFDGTMDEMRLYNRLFSPSEITQLFLFGPGPVGYWKVDENGGTTAYDTSGNSNTGTLINSPGWKPGRFGSALNFDGAGGLNQNDYVNAGTGTTIDDVFDGGGTISVWVYAGSDGENTRGRILDKSNGTDTGWQLFLDEQSGATAQVRFRHYFDTGTATHYITAANFNLNTWNHIEVVYDNSGTANTPSIYINGIKKTVSSSGTTSGTRVSDASQTLYIGNDSTATSTFDGLIDDVKLYNYTRSAKQIIEDMNAGHPAPGSPVGSALLHFDFEEGYGDTVHNLGYTGSVLNGDIGGSGQTCPATSETTCPAWNNSGKFGKTLEYDNADDHIIISDNDSLSFGNGSTDQPFSISAWIYQNASENAGDIVSKYNSSTTEIEYRFLLVTDSISFTVYDDTSSSRIGKIGGTNLSDLTWYHVVGTYDGSSTANGIKLYVNGNIETSTNDNAGTFTNMDNTTSPLYIGLHSSTLAGDFSGKIDEVKIYNQALTADQVKTEFNQGAATVFGSLSTNSAGNASWSSTDSYCPPGQGTGCVGPVGEWKLDENTGTTANDTSTNGNSLTGYNFVSNSSWLKGISGSAVDFESGNNQYFGILDANQTGLDITGPITIESWIKLESYPSTGVAMPIASKWGVSGSNGYLLSAYNISGTTYAGIHVSSDGTATSTQIGTTALSLNTWYHMAGVYDGTYLRIFLNGVENNTPASYSSGIFNNSYPFYIGRVTTLYADMVIDDVRLYNYARTPAQIAWDYNRGAPVAQYDFDECSGSTLHDTAPKPNKTDTGYNGTIYAQTGNSVGTCGGTAGDMWADGASGKYSSSLNFDGTDDYVDLSTSIDTSKLNYFSISGWFNVSNNGSQETIIAKMDNANYGHLNTAFGIWVQQSKLYFETSMPQSWITIETPITNDVWSHFVGTYDGSLMKLYVNGVLKVTASQAGVMSNPSINTLIGAKYNSSNIEYYFQGQIDGIKIWNYALTPLQVKTEYNAGSSVYFGE